VGLDDLLLSLNTSRGRPPVAISTALGSILGDFMPRKKSTIVGLAQVIVVLGFMTTLVSLPIFAASSERVLYSFTGNRSGSEPRGGLIFDADGNLYGAATRAGANADGNVFEVTKGKDGNWTEKVLHSFNYQDGSGPESPLILDAAGNLYGTTGAGGSGCQYGCGVVFQLAPQANGRWIEKVLRRFSGGRDGAYPEAALVTDSTGTLYGTTLAGGNGGCASKSSIGCGTVFQVVPSAGGKWSEKVLHRFSDKGKDGIQPQASLIVDSAGNLFGTTTGGGDYGAGTVFQLSPGTDGNWKERVVLSFKGGGDGADPAGDLVSDTAGNLYGTTVQGGDHTGGTVFELIFDPGGKWSEKVLHSFGNGKDGSAPKDGLIFDPTGNLYGTTTDGGAYNLGTAFRLSPGAGGSWTEKVLHSFGNGVDGTYPEGSLVPDSSGNQYGTTFSGGTGGEGTIFEITP
jgi:uncharacterized repeat protein (TIGR03803 family)